MLDKSDCHRNENFLWVCKEWVWVTLASQRTVVIISTAEGLHFHVQLLCTLWKAASEVAWDTLQLCNAGDASLACLKAQLNSCFCWVCEPVRSHILPISAFGLTCVGSLMPRRGLSTAVSTSPVPVHLISRSLWKVTCLRPLLFFHRRGWCRSFVSQGKKCFWATMLIGLLNWSS